MKKILIPVVACMFLMTACEKTVTVDIPASDPKLVINGFIQKGETFTATIGKSRHILLPMNNGNSLETYTVKDALPVVFENGVPVDTLIYQPGHYNYLGDHTMAADKTYSIKVKAPGFSEASVTTILPSQSQIAELTRVRNARTNSNGDTMDEITLKLNDPAGERNFYLIKIYSNSFGGYSYPVGCVSTTDKDIEMIGANADPMSSENCYDGARLLMRDDNFNGQQKVLRFFVESYNLTDYYAPNGTTYRPYVVVDRITEDQFKYIKSYSAYESATDNPFAEPVNVYSNVQNGYGIFAGYTMAVDTLR